MMTNKVYTPTCLHSHTHTSTQRALLLSHELTSEMRLSLKLLCKSTQQGTTALGGGGSSRGSGRGDGGGRSGSGRGNGRGASSKARARRANALDAASTCVLEFNVGWVSPLHPCVLPPGLFACSILRCLLVLVCASGCVCE